MEKISALLLCIFICASAFGAEVISTSEDRTETSITIYNSNLGLVKEVRKLKLPVGTVELKFMDVASQIRPETVHIVSVDDPESLAVLEQNYEYDLLNPQKLLDKYVDKFIKIVKVNPESGEETVLDAKVLSTNGGAILQMGDEITYNIPGRMIFPEIPKNLIAKPTLVWLLNNAISKQTIETSYLTYGMTWKADYIAVVNKDDTRANIKGWVTLDNTSGAGYEDAKLKLVAGDVNRAEPEYDGYMMGAKSEMLRAAPAPAMQEEAFFEYHLYTLDRLTTVKNNQKKQVSLLESSDVKIDKKLIYWGSEYYYRNQYGEPISNQKIGVYLDIPNKEEYNMGMPLPKGIVRVYKEDSSGSLQFIGEDNIDHTPKDETIRIKMGDAFDVVGERKQTDYKIISHNVYETEWEVQIRNHKEEPVTVEIIEPIPADWKILTSTHEYEKVEAHTLKFTVTVPADGKDTVKYRVKVKWW